MPKQRLECDVEVPEGYELTGEYRRTKPNEPFLDGADDVDRIRMGSSYKYPILRKKKPRRRVFECVSEEPRKAEPGEWYETASNELARNDHKVPTHFPYPVWKEITNETEESL